MLRSSSCRPPPCARPPPILLTIIPVPEDGRRRSIYAHFKKKKRDDGQRWRDQRAAAQAQRHDPAPRTRNTVGDPAAHEPPAQLAPAARVLRAGNGRAYTLWCLWSLWSVHAGRSAASTVHGRRAGTHDPWHPPERVALGCLHACLRVCAGRHIDAGEVACVCMPTGTCRSVRPCQQGPGKREWQPCTNRRLRRRERVWSSALSTRRTPLLPSICRSRQGRPSARPRMQKRACV